MRIALRCIALLAALLIPLGCSQDVDIPPSNFTGQVPIVRVLLLQDRDSIVVSAPKSATLSIGGSKPLPINVPTGGTRITASQNEWRVGENVFATGELAITPTAGTALAVNGTNYRGRLRLVPRAKGKFDVINDLDLDSYLMGVLRKELLDAWEPSTYRAQAIVARTYALYSIHETRTGNPNLHFDVFDDERSQVYGGLDAETNKSREAVKATAGIVVCHGQPGREKIFKAYFSSCCGGVTQSAADAFGEGYIDPLSDQNVNGRCNNAPRFNWGPVVVKKDELTRRFRIFAQKLAPDRAERNMAAVARIDIQKVNRFGRPVRFLVTDVKGRRFSWTGEEIRWAINSDAAPGSSVYSSFFKIINEPDAIRFVEGHGHGHGVGLCQWCSEKLADEGMRHEDIVLAAFQRAVLKRGY